MKLILNNKEISIKNIEYRSLDLEIKEKFISFVRNQHPTIDNYMELNIYLDDINIDIDTLHDYLILNDLRNIIFKKNNNKELMISFDEFALNSISESMISLSIIKFKEGIE